MKKPKWQKECPKEDGIYWTTWKDKNKQWRKTPAEITTFESGTKLIDVWKAGNLYWSENKTFDEVKKLFRFKELLFWPEPIKFPPSP